MLAALFCAVQRRVSGTDELQLPKGLGAIGSKEIEALIEGLDHDDWRERQRCQRQLLGFGDVAIPGLRKGLTHDSLEIRGRCLDIWLENEKRLGKELIDAIKDVPQGADFSAQPKLRSQVKALLARQSLLPLRVAMAEVKNEYHDLLRADAGVHAAHAKAAFDWLNEQYCTAVAASCFSPLEVLQGRGREELPWIRKQAEEIARLLAEKLWGGLRDVFLLGTQSLPGRFNVTARDVARGILQSDRPDAVERTRAFMRDYFGERGLDVALIFVTGLVDALPGNDNASLLLLGFLEEDAARTAKGDAAAGFRLQRVAENLPESYAGLVKRTTKAELKPILEAAAKRAREDKQ